MASIKHPFINKKWPTLAKDWRKASHQMDCDEIIVQGKFDGIRCLAEVGEFSVTFWSREGNQFKHLPFIAEEIKRWGFPEGTILDGEIVLKGKKIPLEEVMEALKGSGREEDLEYVIFDLWHPDGRSDHMNYRSRLDLINMYQTQDGNSSYIGSIGGYQIKRNNDKALHIFYDNFLKAGLEGVIIRNPYMPFENGRTKNLQKFKPTYTEEFKIVDWLEGKGKDAGTAIWICESEGGTFKVRPEGDYETRRKNFLTSDEQIGKMITVRFSEWTRKRKPRNPVGVSIRDYE